VKLLLIFYLLLIVPVVVIYLLATRRSRSPEHLRGAGDVRELQASRELIDRLLTAAIDYRDVDPVLAPIVIDEIRSHQRRLNGPDPGSA
jgi:hypothetical protein